MQPTTAATILMSTGSGHNEDSSSQFDAVLADYLRRVGTGGIVGDARCCWSVLACRHD